MRRELDAIFQHADKRRGRDLVVAVDDDVDQGFAYRIGREVFVVDTLHIDEFRFIAHMFGKKSSRLVELN